MKITTKPVVFKYSALYKTLDGEDYFDAIIESPRPLDKFEMVSALEDNHNTLVRIRNWKKLSPVFGGNQQ